MKILSLCLLGALTSTFAPHSVARSQAEDLTAKYHEFSASGDRAALIELWRANETSVLGTIDRDLEGSLAVWEKATSGEPSGSLGAEDARKIAELTKRALFGASVASEAFDRPIFSDYASAFASWSPENKRDFRAGQAAFGEAVKAIRAGDYKTASEQGDRCATLALPLGDWWGTAMGLGIAGSAQQKLGESSDALGKLSQARLINQALGLAGSELNNLDSMLACLEALGHRPRARVICRELIDRVTDEKRAAYESRLAKLAD